MKKEIDKESNHLCTHDDPENYCAMPKQRRGLHVFCATCFSHNHIDEPAEDTISNVNLNAKAPSALDIQIGGSHYKDYAIQPAEFFIKNKVPGHKTDIIRRILRYDHPTGQGRKDLIKAKHEIDLILELDPSIPQSKNNEDS